MKKRFQESNWLVKIWRYRYYLYVPFKFCWLLIKHRKDSELYPKMLYNLLIGEAQCSMDWYYTLEEVNLKIDARRKKIK
jgi:hypothetical protein